MEIPEQNSNKYTDTKQKSIVNKVKSLYNKINIGIGIIIKESNVVLVKKTSHSVYFELLV